MVVQSTPRYCQPALTSTQVSLRSVLKFKGKRDTLSLTRKTRLIAALKVRAYGVLSARAEARSSRDIADRLFSIGFRY